MYIYSYVVFIDIHKRFTVNIQVQLGIVAMCYIPLHTYMRIQCSYMWMHQGTLNTFAIYEIILFKV